jgi:acyl carrier protein
MPLRDNGLWARSGQRVFASQKYNDAPPVRCDARHALTDNRANGSLCAGTPEAGPRAGNYANVDKEPARFMDTLELLKEFIKKHVDNPPENITADTKLLEIGIDSLNLLEVLFEAEDKFGIRFPNDLPQPETVGQLMELFDKLQRAKTQA